MLWRGLIGVLGAAALASAQDAPFQKAFGLYQAGHNAEAREVLAPLKSKTALDLSLLGSIEFGEGHLAAAEDYLRQALVKEPGLVGARLTLARLVNLQGRSEEALAVVLKAKALAPNDASVLYAVGALCLQMDLIKDGTENLELAAGLQPSPAILYALASARVANRNLPEAIKIYEQLIKAEPENAQVHYAEGAAYFLEGQNEAAKPCFERSLALEPKQVESLYYLGQIADQSGNKQQSIELFKTVIARQPDHARAHVALGMVYRSTGQLEESKSELETAIRLSPDSQKAHYQLGLVLSALQESQQAKEQLEIANQLRASSDERVSWQLVP